MKKTYLYFLPGLLALTLSCSREAPFVGTEPETSDMGSVSKEALDVDVRVSSVIQISKDATRAGNENFKIGDFNVVFTREGASQPTAKYKYSEMPSVVTLPAGNYVCTATYGENRNAAWDSPYILGQSETFTVKAGEIVSSLDPIECRMENVMVTVEFGALLRETMSDDSYVEVSVGSDALKFTLAEVDGERAGYFRHSGETTLVATFKGTVNYQPTEQTCIQSSVKKGNHYRFTFRAFRHEAGSEGGIEGEIRVDGSVDVTNVERGVPVDEDPILDDNERPREDDDDPKPPVTQNPPTITAEAPINLDKSNTVGEGSNVVLHFASSSAGGFTGFTCDIVSSKLTPAELKGVGLSDHLDLVNTEESMVTALTNLGFPVNVGSKKSEDIVLTNFIPLMQALGPCEHKFVLKVTDENGTTEKTLILNIE